MPTSFAIIRPAMKTPRLRAPLPSLIRKFVIRPTVSPLSETRLIPARSSAQTASVPTISRHLSTTSDKQSPNAIKRLFDAYSRAQKERPYVTQVWSFLVIWFIGDASAQLLFPAEDKKAKPARATDIDPSSTSEDRGGIHYDFKRTAKHLTVGVLSAIPTYKWFMFLHRNFNYSSRVLSTAVKVVVQQAVYTPVFNTYFFSMYALLSGASAADIVDRLKHVLPTSIKNSFLFWTGVSVVSFTWIPVQFRAPFAGLASIGWQTYLSLLNQIGLKATATAQNLQQSDKEPPNSDNASARSTA